MNASERPQGAILGEKRDRVALRVTVPDFPSPEIARDLSPNGGGHWAVRSRARLEVARHVLAALTDRTGHVPATVTPPVVVRLRYVYPQHRTRDVDNLTTGVTKAVLDALVGLRVLPADDSDTVREVKAEAVVERGARRLEIEIVEVDDA